MSNDNKYCLICGSYSKGKPQCQWCWKISQEYSNTLWKSKSKINIKKLYKEKLHQAQKEKIVAKQNEICNQLIGIGLYDTCDGALEGILDTAYNDIKYLKLNYEADTIDFDFTPETNKDIEHSTNTNKLNDFRKQNPADILCQDGHYVRSKEERAIDDYLYQTAKLLHAYEPKFRLTAEEQELCKKASKEFDYFYPDFYIPEYNLYIEFFGRNEEKYNLKTDLKIQIYSARKNINFRYLTYKDSNILLEKLEDILTEFKK